MIFLLLILLSQLQDSTLEYRCTMKRGNTIGGIIQSSGLDRDNAQRLIFLLEDSMDVSRCYPDDEVRIRRIEGRLFDFKFTGKSGVFEVDSLFNFKRGKERSVLTIIKGVINGGSLWDAVVSNGGSPNLVYRFADEIFTWDIDFNTETRAGDEFTIIAHKKYSEGKFLSFGDILYASYKSGKKKWEAFHYKPEGKKVDYYDPKGHSLQRVFLRAPLAYTRISSKFTRSRLHPILRIRRPHYGVDYAAPIGTPVRTIGDGKVVFKGWNGGYGNQVIIQHGSKYKTYYGHLSRFARGIKKGKYVTQGNIIGYVGSTGLSTGPHLDFRIKKGGSWIDPLKLDPPSRKAPLSGKELVKFKQYKEGISSRTKSLEASRILSKMMDIRNTLLR